MFTSHISVSSNMLVLLFIFLFCTFSYAQEFRCNDLLGPDNQNLLTFEYTNPHSHLRGVACVSFLNNRDSILMYMEELTGERGKRKQAVGRAQLLLNSNPPTYSGVIHVLTNVGDKHEDLYDLDGDAFTISIVSSTGLGTFSIKSRLSSDNLVYIWQPRTVVPNWRMLVHIPESCGNSVSSNYYGITDPIPQSSLVRKGIVCVLQDRPDLFKFFSIGWRKAGVSGKIRKFIYFGSLKSPSPNFLNVYTGRVHALEFPCGSVPERDLRTDRMAFKETLVATAVRSLTSKSFMLYGDLQEIWFDPGAPINPAEIPKFPIVPVSFESNYKADIGNIYGLPRIN